MYRLSVCTRILTVVMMLWASISVMHVSHADENHGDETNRSGEDRRDALKSFRSSLEFGKQLIKDRPDAEFIEREFAEIGGATALDLFWFVRDHVRPPLRKTPKYPVELEAGVELEIRVVAAHTPHQNDLVELRWHYEGRPIRVVASVNAFKIDFDLDQISACHWTRGAACVIGVRRWVEDVLKLEGEQPAPGKPVPYRVELPWPNMLSDGFHFSSAPELSIMRLRGWPQWFDRVDAYVEDGVLSILIYKKIGQRMGYQDGSKWFSDDFRAKVHERARELGKLSEKTDQDSE